MGGGKVSGLDLAPSGFGLASQRFADDPRFTFRVGDAESLTSQPAENIDGIVISFVLSYLDTRAVERFCKAMVRLYPTATVIIGLTFRSCVDRLEGVEAEPEQEVDAARRYLVGDTSAASGLWDVRRLECYRQSLVARYDIVEEKILPALPQLLWVARPRR